MKYSYLEQIVEFMQSLKQIKSIYRLTDTQIRMVVDNNIVFGFEMNRSDPAIFIAGTEKRPKIYQAPFDVILAKRCNRSTIQKISVHNNDKILRIRVSQSGSYKSETTIIQFEFTGKHTNVILLEDDETVLEALRHIDAFTSTRIVRVGQTLANPPSIPFVPKSYPLNNVETFLKEEYLRISNTKLDRLKKEKQTFLYKKREQLQIHLENLEDEHRLLEESNALQHTGHLILAHLGTIRGYERQIALEDFDGTIRTIEIPEGMSTPSMMAEYFFRRSKKIKQKAIGLHLEKENLQQKIHHLDLFIETVKQANMIEELAILFPPKSQGDKKERNDSIENFWCEGYKISLGKNEKGNIELLQSAKAKDMWFHLKDRPSAHVIVKTDKQQLPQTIIETAAKLCADFSVFEKGRYLVDYTPRREVKIQEGANVLYTNYKTVAVEK